MPPDNPLPRDESITPVSFTPTHKTRRRARRINPGKWLVGLLAILLTGAGAFVFMSRSVEIVIEPAEAELRIDGLAPRISDRRLMLPGPYEITAAAPGYFTLLDDIEVGDAPDQRFSFTLTPLPGHLTVRIAGGVEGLVSVDEAGAGPAPLTVNELEPGPHQVVVTADRYKPFQAEVIVEGRDIAQTFEAELEPNWAAISISSQPAGAEVLVDDIVIGQTPLTADVLDGAHELSIRLDGYKAVQQPLLVEAGQPQTLAEFALDEADAVLRLASRPEGASVTVNGTFRGRTPLTLALEPGELSALRLFKDGYAAATRRITLGSGEERSMSVTLSAQLGTIRFSATPGDAELFIDGIARGSADQVIELPARSHAIEIRKPGYVTYKTSITPRTGVEQRVEARLQTEAERREAAIKPVISTSEGQQLRLFKGGSFQVGASRRERGRRSNEALHPVVLARRFYVAVNEVTNRQFRNFRPSHSSGAFEREDLDKPEQPVGKVSWDDAAAYCNWLSGKEGLPLFYRIEGGKVSGFDPASTGYRLPSEAEWTFVARVLPDGGMLQNAWGGGFPPTRITGNYADQSAAVLLARTLPDYNDRHAAAAPPGSFKPNVRGLNDLDGNVSEWVHDAYTGAITDQKPQRDPLGPATGRYHVIRGASWAHGTVTELRLSFRDFGEAPRQDLGFRIARYLE